MFVRHIMPVAICCGVMASSVASVSAPTKSLIVCSRGCAFVKYGSGDEVVRGRGGAADGWLWLHAASSASEPTKTNDRNFIAAERARKRARWQSAVEQPVHDLRPAEHPDHRAGRNVRSKWNVCRTFALVQQNHRAGHERTDQ